jgi:hypothetical protein
VLTLADHPVACLYLLHDSLWKMEHSGILASLILIAVLPQGKGGLFSCVEDGPVRGIVTGRSPLDSASRLPSWGR